MHKNKFLFFAKIAVLVAIISAQVVYGQNNTNSPYTAFGYGDVSETYAGEYKAMGGTAIGARSNRSINPINPASYSVVDSMTFMFDISVMGLRSRFTDKFKNKSSEFNANLDYITMQFPLSKRIGVSLGLLPYSFAGYNFYTNDTIVMPGHANSNPDSVFHQSVFAGTGGFSQLYGGLSVQLFKNISLGVNAYYMFGANENSKSLTFSNTNAFYSTVENNKIEASHFRFRYGLQAYHAFNKENIFTLGLIYENPTKLNGAFRQTTITNSVEQISPVTDSDKMFGLPAHYGVGLNYTVENKYVFAVDYNLQKWSDVVFRGLNNNFNDQYRLAFGAEILPNARSRKYLESIKYRAGFNISEGYYKIEGVQLPKNFGITFGMGIPLPKSKTVLNAGIEYGKVGTASLLREDYFKFTLNASFNEFWFFKRKL